MTTTTREVDPEAPATVTDSDLPEGWSSARVEDVFESWGGATPSTGNRSYWGGKIPWVSSKDIKTWRINHGTDFITEKALKETRLRVCPKGSVLVVVRSGILANSLPIALADSELTINQDLKAFYSLVPMLNEWLALAFRAETPSILGENRKDGTTVQSIRFDELKELPLSVPPLAEQERIVARIEDLLPKVNASRARLAKVSKILKRFRQAVLAAACAGRLTEGWRERHLDVVPATLLIEHLKRERQTQKENEKKKPPEIAPIGVADLPELPDTWVWGTLDQLIIDGPQNGLYKPQDQYGQGVPIVRIDDFQDDFIRKRDDLQKLHVTQEETRIYGLGPEDLLINRVNSPSHIGKCLVVPQELCPAVFESNMMRMTLANQIEPRWIAAYLRSADGRARLTENAKWAVNQVSINQTDVRSTLVALPPAEEQHEIVRRIEALFKLADAIEKRVKAQPSARRNSPKRSWQRPFEENWFPLRPNSPAAKAASTNRPQCSLSASALRGMPAVEQRNPTANLKRPKHL